MQNERCRQVMIAGRVQTCVLLKDPVQSWNSYLRKNKRAFGVFLKSPFRLFDISSCTKGKMCYNIVTLS